MPAVPLNLSESISIHTPREGSDRSRRSPRPERRISIHTPREGSDDNDLYLLANASKISIHTPREGSDIVRDYRGLVITDFNPHSPRGERRRYSKWSAYHDPFQSTLPARGATVSGSGRGIGRPISIHTPREGSDLFVCRNHPMDDNFNPHSPRGERRPFAQVRLRQALFQSTLPARGATFPGSNDRPGGAFQSTLPARGATGPTSDIARLKGISIHTPREGSDTALLICGHRAHISIHTPREGSDRRKSPQRRKHIISIHTPREGSDPQPDEIILPQRISIHTPREGSDSSRRQMQSCPVYFNPHSPRGERRICSIRLSCGCLFQSTLPARGATRIRKRFLVHVAISIHTPREGSD